jgi:hypothetical protein
MAVPRSRLATVQAHLLHSSPAAGVAPIDPGCPVAELLDDAAMQAFVREGYVKFNLCLPSGYNEGIVERLGQVIEKHGNPGNNMLPMVPELSTMLQHPKVDGALRSILGADYYVHLHRHPHFRDNIDEGEPGKVHHLHKDSMINSRFPMDGKRRQHRTRMCMLVYFPQPTPLELGPTAILPRSQYLLHQPERDEPTVPYEGAEALPLAGPAGTVAIIHYDMLHTSTNKVLEQPRHMIKFLFSRMTEPEVSGPSWHHGGGGGGGAMMKCWQPTGHPQDPIWSAIWDWHTGRPDKPSCTGQRQRRGAVEALSAQLRDHRELVAVRAAYSLGVDGGEAGRRVLMRALCEPPPAPLPDKEGQVEEDEEEEEEEEEEEKLMVEHRSSYFASDATVQSGYGLVAMGGAR